MQSPDQPAGKPLSKGNVKMPKLVITKYDGTYEKWLSFWNKFKAEIDAADIPPVTKFAHLKELLESDVCESIDGLPFSPEGYERAKNILKSNYGKTSEIVRAYIDNINGLPVVTGCIPNEIHRFCQTLNYNVQSLETLGRPRERKTGMARLGFRGPYAGFRRMESHSSDGNFGGRKGKRNVSDSADLSPAASPTFAS